MLSRQLRIDAFGRAGPGDRDLPGPGRDRHLRACPRRQPGDPGALHRRLRTAGGRRHRRRDRLRRSPRPSRSMSATWRSLRPFRCPAGCRRLGRAPEAPSRQRPSRPGGHEGFRSHRDPAEPGIRRDAAARRWMTFVDRDRLLAARDEPRDPAAGRAAARRAASRNGWSAPTSSYHRNVPTLVQLMLWYFGISSLLPDALQVLADGPQRRGRLRDHRPRPLPGRLLQRGSALGAALRVHRARPRRRARSATALSERCATC